MCGAGSIAVSEVLKPGELQAGQRIEVVVLTWRVVGPQMTAITPQLTQALQQTFQVRDRERTSIAPRPPAGTCGTCLLLRSESA